MNDEKEIEMTVDAVVRQLNITPRTLRYYEEIGLITPASRSSGGHRLYNQTNVDRVKQIIGLKQELGFSLDEIKEILNAEKSLETLKETFRKNNNGEDSQKEIADRYIEVLQQLIYKMDAKIQSVSSLRNTYQERLDRVLKAQKSNDVRE